jgi:hypothetical protein
MVRGADVCGTITAAIGVVIRGWTGQIRQNASL